ncbi:DNA-binding protein YbaB [Nonomuraea fuscirosea]|uniref:DNA-binding protein YbaB n=1 Tax=Nonomuraea fuscirosea TaxID=1291556 RepID=A0A2T0N6U7_9ACTN|nr:YbaB/EbfC family nucleoid-associated protein [Nonomuraea fuscirosea]PRX68283.1 DNA-binding protein YbaB [Nonomuraea fuscirosea]
MPFMPEMPGPPGNREAAGTPGTSETPGSREMRELMERLDAVVASARRAEERAAEWSARQFVGRADEGRIVARTDALGTLVALEIHPLSRKRLDARRLADEITAAVVMAERAATDARDELMNAPRP